MLFICRKFSLTLLMGFFLLIFPTISLSGGVAPPSPPAPAKKKPINIAAIFSLTGQRADANRSSVLGTQWAIEEINAAGGLLGRYVNLLLFDDMGTPIGSSLAAYKAANANVSAIIGAQWSSNSLAVAKVAQEHKIPMISNFSTHPELTTLGKYIFRICFTDDFQGKVLAEFAISDLRAKSALVFVDMTSDYSLVFSEIFRTHFESLGGKITDQIMYKRKKGNFEKLIEKATKKKTDVIFLSGHVESGSIVHRLQEAGIKSHFLGGDGWVDKAFFNLGGKYLRQGYYTTHWSSDFDNPESKKFKSVYGTRSGFGTGAALAYDAVMVLAKAIEEGGSQEREKIVESLFKLPPHKGVTGSINFDQTGNPVKDAVIMEIKNGTPLFLKTLSPQ